MRLLLVAAPILFLAAPVQAAVFHAQIGGDGAWVFADSQGTTVPARPQSECVTTSTTGASVSTSCTSGGGSDGSEMQH